jgi:putative MFS transporter
MIILAVVTGIMAVGRYFAGGLVHRLNPTGVLLGSAIFSFAGLMLLSYSSGPVMTTLSAAVFAVGVCYFWPTMIGVTSEYKEWCTWHVYTGWRWLCGNLYGATNYG